MRKDRLIPPSVEPIVSDDLQAELRQLIEAGSRISAIKRLRDETGIGLQDAKAWVTRDSDVRRPRAPCPYCGQPLRSMAAQQCLECGMDWHDPQNVVCRK
ncbi:MAG: hypothetical protein AB7O68_26215 [Pirellulales bacterium]